MSEFADKRCDECQARRKQQEKACCRQILVILLVLLAVGAIWLFFLDCEMLGGEDEWEREKAIQKLQDDIRRGLGSLAGKMTKLQ